MTTELALLSRVSYRDREETAWVLSHFRPEPALVEVTRTAATLFTAYTFVIQGPRAVRSLVTLRRLPPAPPSTLIRAGAMVMGAAPELLGSDRSALHLLCDSDEPLLAGIANYIASYLCEQQGDLEGALKAAGRTLEAFEHRATPVMRLIAHSRIGELCLQVGQGEAAQRHHRAALPVLEELGAWSYVVQMRWGMVPANLQLGAIDEAEHWLEQTALNSADDTISTIMPLLGVRAEIMLARGEVEAGLRLWRRHTAEQANGSAYAQAVSSCADLSRDDLRAAALAVLRERDQG